MKEQINKYARGTFEYEPLIIGVSPDSVSDVVQKNKVYGGTLRIKEQKNRTIKGLIYSTNNRIHIVNTQFIGEDNLVEYTVDTTGIEAGDRLTGFFHIVTNGGEENVPFEFEVEAGIFESELGNVKNLFHFANLAQTNPDEAVKLFELPEFPKVFFKDDLSMSKLRAQLLLSTDIRTSVEEFLIAIHKKTRVKISLENPVIRLSDVSEDIRETVVIDKDVWGRIEVKVVTDGAFIELGRKIMTDDDFVGGKLEYSFLIRKDKLHAGKNSARIRFITPYEEKEAEVHIDNSSSEERHGRILTEKKSIVRLMNVYMEFRLGRRNISWWIDESKKVLAQLLEIDEENPMYCLVMSQVLIAEKKTNEAKFYLDCAKDGAIASKDSNYVLYCYYLYVNTIYNRDRAYAKETAATVKNIYDRHSRDWRILSILLNLDVEMSKNKSLKLLRIKEQYKDGMRSPMLYLEACIILNEQPMLLRVLNDFEISLLRFGCRVGIIDNRLLRQAALLTGNTDNRPEALYRLLTDLYNISQDKEVLEAICSLLIRCMMTDGRYYEWYSRGVEKGLHITKLFEYYMASRPATDTTPLPKMVLLYFGYNNELDYKKKAYLYANLIQNMEDNPQLYRNYIPHMREFVREQLKTGEADENTGIVFKEYFTPDMINADNAKTAADIVFTYKVTCKNPNMGYVIVGHKETELIEKYMLSGGTAYVRIYTEEAVICFEDNYGRIYKDGVEYEIKRIINDTLAVKELFAYCEDNLYLALHFCERRNNYQDSTLETVRLYNRTARVESLRPEYRQHLITQVIDYYFENYEGDEMSELLDSIVMEKLNEGYQAKLAEALIIHGRYDEAYDITKRVRAERLGPKRVLKLCEHIIEEGENSEELYVPEENFISLVYYAFSKGKYNDRTLRFLNIYFNSATEDMINVWKACIDDGIDVYQLEERILCQILFSGHYSGKTQKIFGHYYNNGAKERIVEAYLAYNSYNYFVKGMIVPEDMFKIIEERLNAEKDTILICRMALLKYYSDCRELDGNRLNLAKTLMENLSREGYIFAFYEKFADSFHLPYEVADKTIVEYRTSPESRVIIHCLYEDKNEGGEENGRYVSMDMKNVYGGIFVKTFVMFYGENIRYYITEENEQGLATEESCAVENRAVGANGPEGRYEMINEMLACMQLHDSQSLNRQLHIYGINSAVVDKLFAPII